MRTRALLSGIVLAGVAASCASPERALPPSTSTATAPASPTSDPIAIALGARLPAAADPRFAPSQMRIVKDTARAGDVLTEVESCSGCHADAAAAWRTSAHAFASFNNPIYRPSIDRFRDGVADGKHASRFCGGCHDVSLIADGGLDAEVKADDMRAHGGITCRTCHGVASTRPDGDGSYDLDLAEIPIPKENDPDSVARHKAKVGGAALRTPALCASCHRVFLDEQSGNVHHMAGQDEATPWMRSAWSGSLSERVDVPLPVKECRSCHMPREDAPLGDASTGKDGKIASHRFLGGHTWLASMRNDKDQLARIEAFLKTAATIDVAAAKAGARATTIPADGAEVAAGERVVVDVVVRNVGAGHRFPAGVVDAQDTWIEVDVDDAKKARVAHDDEHVLRATQIDSSGKPVTMRETDHFRGVVTNATIGPRDAAVVRYAFVVPASAAMPLHVTARLRHRSRDLDLQKMICDASKTPRGKAFAAAGQKRNGVALDPCKVQPVTELARSEVFLGSGPASGEAAHPGTPWERLYAHGLGLSHALQEWVGEARLPLERAVATAADERQRAMAYALLAQIAGREGNPDEAARWADLAEKGAPNHPALSRARGEALANVWRWRESLPWLRTAATLAPHDDSSYARLAIALGSVGAHDAEAIDVAQRGLALQPRDPDLLRAQALCLANAGAPPALRSTADDAYLHHRVDDELPALKGKCSMTVPGCAFERNPVHVHEMTVGR